MAFEAQDLFWLLLPLAAASGWYAARRESSRPASTGLSQDYFRGVNFLLNEQPDKAIEVFTRMLEVNTETVETHLALGSLFRQRGEVERATRIHQNLIARPSLNREQRAQAQCELAKDYLKAGLLDRAESLFLDLAGTPLQAEQALAALMGLYEQEKDWDKAISIGKRLARISDRNIAPLLAHYYCEWGEAALRSGDVAQANACVTAALKHDEGCTRANILRGKVAATRGEEREAIDAWKQVEQQNAWLLDEVIGDIAAAFRRVNDESGLYAYLLEVAARQPGLCTISVLAEVMAAHTDQAATLAFVSDLLQRQPTVPGLKRMIDMQLGQTEPSLHVDINLIKKILDQLAGQQEGYQCRQCGYHSQRLSWQCPACHGWNTAQLALLNTSQSITAQKNQAVFMSEHEA